MSLGRKVFAAPANLWMNWPLWGGLLAVLLMSKHAWVLFAPAEHAIPGTAFTTQTAQTEQLFGIVATATPVASFNGIQPIGIFASNKNGFAVLQTDAGQVGVGLGGQVVAGVTLAETHADYVVLESHGIRQRIDLVKAHEAVNGGAPFRSNPISAAPAPAPTTPPSHASPSALNQLTPEQRKIVEQQQRELKRSNH